MTGCELAHEEWDGLVPIFWHRACTHEKDSLWATEVKNFKSKVYMLPWPPSRPQ